MRGLALLIVSLAMLAGGVWLADLIGDGSISDLEAMVGRALAVLLGVFGGIAVHMIWGAAADDADFQARFKRWMEKQKSDR